MKLQQLDQEGWFLAPKELPHSLFMRKAIVDRQENRQEAFLGPAGRVTWSLFRFSLKEVPLIISNDSLLPWQGAVLWEYTSETGECFPVIQMRKNFLNKEILAHELVHAARFAFKEPFFEEILAYQTSKQRWRRFLGPLFLFQQEPFIWMGVILLGLSGFVFFDSFFCFWLPYLFLGGLLLRLTLLQGLFARAKWLLQQSGAKDSALAILCRLSDREIIRLAFSSRRTGQEILSFLQQTSKERFSILKQYFVKDRRN